MKAIGSKIYIFSLQRSAMPSGSTGPITAITSLLSDHPATSRLPKELARSLRSLASAPLPSGMQLWSKTWRELSYAESSHRRTACRLRQEDRGQVARQSDQENDRRRKRPARRSSPQRSTSRATSSATRSTSRAPTLSRKLTRGPTCGSSTSAASRRSTSCASTRLTPEFRYNSANSIKLNETLYITTGFKLYSEPPRCS